MAMLISVKIGIQKKNISRDKEGHFIIKADQFIFHLPRRANILNVHACNSKSFKMHEQKLRKRKTQIHVADFNIPLLVN